MPLDYTERVTRMTKLIFFILNMKFYIKLDVLYLAHLANFLNNNYLLRQFKRLFRSIVFTCYLYIFFFHRKQKKIKSYSQGLFVFQTAYALSNLYESVHGDKEKARDVIIDNDLDDYRSVFLSSKVTLVRHL